jgi:hypothetical protein
MPSWSCELRTNNWGEVTAEESFVRLELLLAGVEMPSAGSESSFVRLEVLAARLGLLESAMVNY